jgi:hypothetical protein
VTRVDEEDGQVWMCTGDEAVMDEEGYVQSENYVDILGLSKWVTLTWIGVCSHNSRREGEGKVLVTAGCLVSEI